MGVIMSSLDTGSLMGTGLSRAFPLSLAYALCLLERQEEKKLCVERPKEAVAR